MQDLLPEFLSFPPTSSLSGQALDKELRLLVQNLRQTSISRLAENSETIGEPLDILDPSKQTLPYLFILIARIRHGSAPGGEGSLVFTPGAQLWGKATAFLMQFDPIQVRYAGEEWRYLVEMVIQTAVSASQSSAAIVPVREAMLRLDPSTATFTSTHTIFAYICLESREFQAALPILDNDIHFFPSVLDKGSLGRMPVLLCAEQSTSLTFITAASGFSARLTYKESLEYFLYAAMIYMAVKNWSRALHFLEIVITAPASKFTSLIMVEAYKKWVLASLLATGTALRTPSITSSQATKTYKALARPYDALGDAFKSGIGHRLKEEIDAGQSVWAADFNTGLVVQVYDAFRRYSVLGLEKTYAALSISEIARLTSPNPKDLQETEAYVISLIESGHLKAELTRQEDTQSSVLRFDSAFPSLFSVTSETRIRDELALQTQALARSLQYIQANGQKVELTKEHIDFLRKQKASGEAAASGGANGFEIDEDMMADL